MNSICSTRHDLQYDVLLILTDGVVSDYSETVDRVITASRRIPLSIIVIGIGNNNFKRMKDIDCDDKLLTSVCGTRQAVRGGSFSFQALSASPLCLALFVMMQIPRLHVFKPTSYNKSPFYVLCGDCLDIVQFVAFKEFEHAPPERLGAAVLQELPGNIVEYFIGICDPPIMPGQKPAMANFNY